MQWTVAIGLDTHKGDAGRGRRGRVRRTAWRWKTCLSSAYLSTRDRTSTAPPIRAAGIRAAISSAASRSSASTR
jgi:hypothetical protein